MRAFGVRKPQRNNERRFVDDPALTMWNVTLFVCAGIESRCRGAEMASIKCGLLMSVLALFAAVGPAAAQDVQGTSPPTTPPQQNGPTPPAPAPPAANAPNSQLPPVQVIQKEQKTPATATKKTVAKKPPPTLPPAAAPTPPAAPVTAQVPGLGGNRRRDRVDVPRHRECHPYRQISRRRWSRVCIRY